MSERRESSSRVREMLEGLALVVEGGWLLRVDVEGCGGRIIGVRGVCGSFGPAEAGVSPAVAFAF